MKVNWTLILVIVTYIAGVYPAYGGAASDELSTDCESMLSRDFLLLEDAPTRVTAVKTQEENGEIPAHCEVNGYIAPQVGFTLKLPEKQRWNGKFFHQGVGGFVGRIFEEWCDEWLRRGYACVTTDSGHKGSDTLWAFNNMQARIDYGFRAVHVTTIAGKALTETFYGGKPRYSYFMGCSGGGRQALVEATRFPDDFDGIIAMDPGWDFSKGFAALNWNGQAVTTDEGAPLFSASDLDFLHESVLAQCDMDDGVKDGVVGNPPACHVNLAPLACKKGHKGPCLTPEQINAARKVYGGAVNSAGERLFVGSTMPGTESTEDGSVGLAFGSSQKSQGFIDLLLTGPLQSLLFFPPDPGFRVNYQDFDFDNDLQRLNMMQVIMGDGGIPDFRPYKAKGGKLILAQGWGDSGSPLPLNTIDLYETTEKVFGGRAKTQEFLRLFMMPGRAHCAWGSGANVFDYVGALEAWVENGKAPDYVVGAHLDYSKTGLNDIRHRLYITTVNTLPKNLEDAKFTRPVYPYPMRAVYKGKGDPNDWRSFKPVNAPVNWTSFRKWQDYLRKGYLSREDANQDER